MTTEGDKRLKPVAPSYFFMLSNLCRKEFVMIVLMGKTASGKTTEAKLLENHGFHRVVTDTTRAPRPGEKDGVDYHFLSEPEFADNQRNGLYAETATYTMADGKTVRYASRISDYMNPDGVIVLTPDGVRDIRKIGVNATVIYLKADTEILRKRLEKRGDNPAEIERRLRTDSKDFANAESLCNFSICTDGISKTEVLEKILRCVEN